MAQQSTEQADGSQTNAALPEYEQTLLDLAERDAARALENPDVRATRSVALWMADQVAEHARNADLDPRFARMMQEHAKEIRERVLSAPSARATRLW